MKQNMLRPTLGTVLSIKVYFLVIINSYTNMLDVVFITAGYRFSTKNVLKIYIFYRLNNTVDKVVNFPICMLLSKKECIMKGPQILLKYFDI